MIEHVDVQDYCPIFHTNDIVLCGNMRQQVWDWSRQHGIAVEAVELNLVGRDVWHVEDQKQRMLFLLRWGHERIKVQCLYQ